MTTLTRADILAGKPDALDYSTGRPSISGLVGARIGLVCRYLSPPPNPKNVSASEIAALHAAGIGVLLNWESDAGRAALGAAAGAEDGAQAKALAVALGAPPGQTIYFSTDFDAQAAQYATIRAYYKAAAQAIAGTYDVGAYGHGELLDMLTDWDLIWAGWQTYAWSKGYISDNADLYQYLNGQVLAGAKVDFNRMLTPEGIDAWWADGHEPSGGGTPITPNAGDDDMSIEMIRNTDNGAVIAHLGGGVLTPCTASNWSTWNNLGRPVTQLHTGPWTAYTNMIAAGNQANIAAIAKATEEAIGAALS